MTSFMYFNLIYIDNQNKSVEKIPIAVRNILSIYDMAEKILGSERESLVLLLFEDGTRIVENEYLQSLNNDTNLLICAREQYEELFSCYYYTKKYFFNNEQVGKHLEGYFLLKIKLSSLN